MAIDPDFWRGRRVLLTGHTGFKGAWLSLWLQAMGAEVTGLAPGVPTEPSLYRQARVAEGLAERAVDVRDAEALAAAVREAAPEIVFHLAAQPMVRRSLLDPVLTYEVNVMGTVNLLEAVRGCQVSATVVVTSDKCYENTGAGRPFREGDPLGGHDPYSSSKACAELVVAAYRSSFGDSSPLASARAGNVIGGGDWGEDRLVADAVRAVEQGQPLSIRNPDAVRPWQHVLDPLSGYLQLAQRLSQDPAAARAWNFGPPPEGARPVRWVAQRLAELWEGELRWEADARANPPEAGHLTLDSSAARELLGWECPWGLEQALQRIVEWHRAQRAGADMRELSLRQLQRYLADGRRSETISLS